MTKTKTTAAEVALDKSIYTKSINHREKQKVKVITNNEPAAEEFHYHSGSNCDTCANAFYNKYAPARYYARRAFPDVKVLEELFVEATLALLSSLPVRLAKTHLAHWYIHPEILTTAVLRALVPKTTTVTQAKRLYSSAGNQLPDTPRHSLYRFY